MNPSKARFRKQSPYPSGAFGCASLLIVFELVCQERILEYYDNQKNSLDGRRSKKLRKNKRMIRYLLSKVQNWIHRQQQVLYKDTPERYI